MPHSTSRARLAVAWAALLVAAAFGPYVAPGLRTEQVLVYLSALAAGGVLLASQGGRRDLLRSSPVPWLWGVLLVLLSGYGWLTRGEDLGVPRGSLSAGIDNFALPLAVMVVVVLLVRLAGSRLVLDAVCAALVVLGVLNTVVALCQNFIGFEKIAFATPFLQHGLGGASIAVRASVNGRFSGVINQPSESGLIYTLALLALVYLLAAGRVRAWVGVPLLVALTVGGMLSLSKIFFAGFVLALVAAALQRRSRGPVVVSGLLTQAALVAAAYGGLAGRWGLRYAVRRITQGNGSWLFRLTAGRLGDSGAPRPHTLPRGTVAPTRTLVRPGAHPTTTHPVTGQVPHPAPGTPHPTTPPVTTGPVAPHTTPPGTPHPATGHVTHPAPRPTPRRPAAAPDTLPPPTGLGDAFDWILHRRPVLGVGAGGLKLPYDSAFLEIVVTGGLVGCLLMLLAAAAMVRRAFQQRHRVPREVSFLAAASLVCVLGAAIGTPSLTGNRMATVVWLLLSVTVVVPWRERPGREAGPETSAAGPGAAGGERPGPAQGEVTGSAQV